MKQLVLKTSRGNTLTYPHMTTLKIDADGTQHEIYVSELKTGDKVLYKADRLLLTLPMIIDVLRREIPGYNEARAFCYMEQEGHETTRLRYDIMHALAKSNPKLFLGAELAYLDDCILGVRGDFSQRTMQNIAEYVSELLSRHGINYSIDACVNWINGKTIHPVRYAEGKSAFETAVKIGNLLESEPLASRSRAVAEKHGDENQYLLLTAAHRTFAAMINVPKGTKKRKEKTAEYQTGHERVFKSLSSWRKTLLSKLGPRIEENIVLAEVRGSQLVDYSFEKEEESEQKPELTLKRGVVIISDEEAKRNGVYEKLKMENPERRKNTLWSDIEKSFEACDIVYRYFTDLIFEQASAYVFEDWIKQKKTEEQFTLPAALGFISPIYEYDPLKFLEMCRKFAQIELNALDSRDSRREYIMELKKRLPKDHPAYPMIKAVYDTSFLLRSLFDENEFIKKIAYTMRSAELQALEQIYSYSPERKEQKRKTIEKGKPEHRALYVASRIARTKELCCLVRDADENIPQEISMIRAFPVVLGHRIRQVNEALKNPPLEAGGEREREIFDAVCEKYGIETERFLEMFASHLVEAASYFAERRNVAIPNLIEDSSRISQMGGERAYPLGVIFKP